MNIQSDGLTNFGFSTSVSWKRREAFETKIRNAFLRRKNWRQRFQENVLAYNLSLFRITIRSANLHKPRTQSWTFSYVLWFSASWTIRLTVCYELTFRLWTIGKSWCYCETKKKIINELPSININHIILSTKNWYILQLFFCVEGAKQLNIGKEINTWMIMSWAQWN